MESFYIYTICEYHANDYDITNRVVVYRREEDAKRHVDHVFNFYNTKGMIKSMGTFIKDYGYILHLKGGDIVKVRYYEDIAE